MKRLIGNKRVKIECKLNEFFQLFGKIDQNALASSSAGLKKINFFKPFATLPNKYKADYQAKTFIHEFAHLANANLFSTKYVAKEVYRAKALDLALNNPFRAVNNADNFGFYAICRFGNPSKGFKSRFCCGRPKDNNQDILCKILIG